MNLFPIVFRAGFQGKRSGPNKALEINVYSQSPCTSTHLPQVTHLLLDKVLILAKKVRQKLGTS